MLSCPRCQHLNSPGEETCELCGAPLDPGGSMRAGAEVRLSEPIEAPPPGPPPGPPPLPPQSSTSSTPESRDGEGGGQGLTAALLDALEQDKEEGRARGEGPRARNYMLRPLPVPDDLPVPNLGGSVRPMSSPVAPAPPPEGVPLAAKVKPAASKQPSSSAAAEADAQPVQPAREEVPADALAPEVACPYCHTSNPPGNRFCGGCGARLPLEREAVSQRSTVRSEQPAPIRTPSIRVTLVCISEDGSDGARIPLNQAENVLGRASDARFSSDSFLSPRHAKLVVDGDTLYVEDMSSLNGTFVRIRDKVILDPGDCFLMGRQVLRLERFNHQINPKARASDGTRYMGSPIPSGSYKLLQVGIGGVIQNVYCVPVKGAVLGRERGDITFPGDKFMSARHAQIIVTDEGEVELLDANSSNGTWTKISKRHRLYDQDFIFLGQQLFRVAIEPV